MLVDSGIAKHEYLLITVKTSHREEGIVYKNDFYSTPWE